METVIDKGGDCEDTAILMAFIAINLDYEAAFLEFRNDGILGIGGWAHCDLGIAASYEGEFNGTYWTENETKYYFTSCNGKGYKIGEYNNKWGGSAYIYPDENYF